MNSQEIKEYWQSISRTIAPILQRAEACDEPQDYQRIVDEEVMPHIFGAHESISLDDVFNLQAYDSIRERSLWEVIGKNYEEDVIPFVVRNMHQKIIDPEGNLIVPVTIPHLGEESAPYVEDLFSVSGDYEPVIEYDLSDVIGSTSAGAYIDGALRDFL